MSPIPAFSSDGGVDTLLVAEAVFLGTTGGGGLILLVSLRLFVSDGKESGVGGAAIGRSDCCCWC